MNRLIVAAIAVVALSVSPAWATKHPHHAHHHLMKPAATNTTATQTTWPFGGVSELTKRPTLATSAIPELSDRAPS